MEEEKQKRIKEEKQENKQKSIKSLIKKGIPAPLQSKSSSSTTSTKHVKCEINKGKFNCIPNFEALVKTNGKKRSKFISHFGRDSKLTVNSEADLHHYVQYLIQDAISLCGLENEITVSHEEAIVGLKPDYWVVKKNTHFVGVLEVKKHDEKVFTNETIFGQIFDYLVGMSYIFCKIQSFAILTTLEKAMVLFTEESQGLAASDSNQLGITKLYNREKLLTCVKEAVKTKSNLTIKRALYHSNIVEIKEPTEYLLLLCSAIIKMNSCLHDKRKEETRFVVPLTINSEGVRVKKVELNLNMGKLTDVSGLTPMQLEEIYLIKNLGGGGDGFCWFACTVDGISLAVKSFKTNATGESIQNESALWKTIWGFDTSVNVFFGQGHLIMPFFKMVTRKDYSDRKKFEELVLIACQTFSEKGYQHDDLKVRHVAKYINTHKVLMYIFIDLSRVSKIEKTNEQINISKWKMFHDIMEDLESNVLKETPSPSPNKLVSQRFQNLHSIPETPPTHQFKFQCNSGFTRSTMILKETLINTTSNK
ncbi:hypothetical protein ACTA71_000236 [Dictyostelium dimigraforme]